LCVGGDHGSDYKLVRDVVSSVAVSGVEDGIVELLLWHGHTEYRCIEIVHRYR